MSSTTATKAATTTKAATYKPVFNEEKVACKIGNDLAAKEQIAIDAFGITDDDKDKSKRQNLAKALGLSSDTKADSLRIAAKYMLDKARSMYDLLSELLTARKRAMDGVIQNIGR